MSELQEHSVKKSLDQRNQRIMLIVGTTLIALAVAIWLYFGSSNNGQPIKIQRPMIQFNAMGDPNASVQIIEYSDFQCPYCALFVRKTEQQIIDSYIKTGKVHFEYRSFGGFAGLESVRAAEAAYCAGDQGKFWNFHDFLFENQKGENSGNFSDDRLTGFAKQLGLDMNQFDNCFKNNLYLDQVTQDGKDAAAAKIRATPSFLINGVLLEGAQPFSAFQAQIEPLLK